MAPNLLNEVNQIIFTGGNLANNIEEWEKLTHDPYILEAIMGYEIEFNDIPQQVQTIREYSTTDLEASILDAEVKKLLASNVIVRTSHESGEVFSPVFLRDKPGGSHRMILNLTSRLEVDPPEMLLYNLIAEMLA